MARAIASHKVAPARLATSTDPNQPCLALKGQGGQSPASYMKSAADWPPLPCAPLAKAQSGPVLHRHLAQFYSGVDSGVLNGIGALEAGEVEPGAVAIVEALNAYGAHFEHPGWQDIE